jgi:hypothetical protein
MVGQALPQPSFVVPERVQLGAKRTVHWMHTTQNDAAARHEERFTATTFRAIEQPLTRHTVELAAAAAVNLDGDAGRRKRLVAAAAILAAVPAYECGDSVTRCNTDDDCQDIFHVAHDLMILSASSGV